MKDLTPQQIVRELDRYIVGQTEAKRVVAVALRNRYRRLALPPELQAEISTSRHGLIHLGVCEAFILTLIPA